MPLTPEEMIALTRLIALRKARFSVGRTGTPQRLRRGRDRSLGTTPGINSIHNLRHSVNKGYSYA